MEQLLRTVWRKTLKGVYERLVGRYMQALVSRLDSISARLDELDAHVRVMLAAGWENAALERRMAALEDRLDRDGVPRALEPAESPDRTEVAPPPEADREPADAR